MSTAHQDVPETAESERTPARRPPERNLGRRERAASAVVGGVLLARGVRQRSLRGAATALAGGLLLSRAARGHSRLYEALDVRTAAEHGPSRGASADAVGVARSVTVGGRPDDLAEFWREPTRLSRVVGHVATVTRAGEDRHRWKVDGPLGWSASWETRIVEDRPGELLRWESVPGAAVPSEGTVRFRPAPADRGTEVTLHVRFDPPGGALGRAALERLGVVPATLVNEALYRFRSLAETGEIPTLERNPSARGRVDRL